jgi:phosphoenolpyruvate phosphomutase / 2-hydroxyethylphosphonate cytidylyltransferase
VGPKRNSLFGTDASQEQEEVFLFAEKIRAGKRAQVTEDFMVIARIESLIAGVGQEDALMRAEAYIDAGADGIMIHSSQKTPAEVLTFLDAYGRLSRRVPVVVVPSTYSSVTEGELAAAGARIVIYANHLLRSAYPAMTRTAESILRHGRAYEAEELCLPIREVLALIPEAG